MFTLIELLIYNKGKIVSNTDFSTPLHTLYKNDKVYITYKDESTGVIEQIDLGHVNLPNNLSLSLEDYIFTAINYTVPKIRPVKTLAVLKQLRYVNLTESPVKANKTNINETPSSKLKDFKDIVLEGILDTFKTLSYVNNNILFMVGGMYYPITINGGKLYLADSIKSISRSKFNVVSMLDFSELGGFDLVSISELEPYIQKNNCVSFKLALDKREVTPIVILDGVVDFSFSLLRNSVGDNYTINLDPIRAINNTHLKDFKSCSWIDHVEGHNTVVDISSFKPLEYIKNNCYILLIKTSTLCVESESTVNYGHFCKKAFHRNPTGVQIFSDYTLCDYSVTKKAFYGYELLCTEKRQRLAFDPFLPMGSSGVIDRTNNRYDDKPMDTKILNIYTI